MEVLLTILILVADPGSDDLANALSERLAAQPRVQVARGATAAALLSEAGLSPGDLGRSPDLGDALTRSRRDLAVVALDRRDAGGDTVIEARVFAEGRNQLAVAIVGADASSAAALSRAVLPLLASAMPGASSANGASAVAGLVEARNWRGVVAAVPAGAKDAKTWYWLIQAQARLGDASAASAALIGLRTEHPGHFLIPAAADLVAGIPAAAATAASPRGSASAAVDDDGSNVLR